MTTTRDFVEGNKAGCGALRRVGPAGLRILDRLVNAYGAAEAESAWLHAYAIHKETGVTYPAVWTFLVGLEKAGLVETRRARVGGRARKLYRLNEKGYRGAVDVFRRKAMGASKSPALGSKDSSQHPSQGGSKAPWVA